MRKSITQRGNHDLHNRPTTADAVWTGEPADSSTATARLRADLDAI